MLDSYEVNVSTLAIIAVNDKLSRIIEKDKEFFINKSTISIIDESCRYYGSTYEGRCDGTKCLLNYSYKLPIMIEDSRNIIFFPTISPDETNCSWIALNKIFDINPVKDDKSYTEVIFDNGRKINVPISYKSMENQILRASRLESVIRNRKNK